ncbi:secreted phosphoprotein 24-like [Scyliorhinus canicula]|uniref:secreted phosphoprotein 24-like n=1 Tax=Scyliorhinus canicula TaxID=7830 RepID=UPI0018F4A0F7|nr:secreted phosphoprotein 24-like [Scyliorhinus canicula]
MKTVLFIFAAAQVLYCSGERCGNSFPAGAALNATIRKLNDNLTNSNLLAVTNCTVLQAVDFGKGFLNVTLKIDVHETTCLADSGKDPSTCSLKTSPGAKTAICTSQVILDQINIDRISLECSYRILTTPMVPVTSESSMTSLTSAPMTSPTSASMTSPTSASMTSPTSAPMTSPTSASMTSPTSASMKISASTIIWKWSIMMSFYRILKQI